MAEAGQSCDEPLRPHQDWQRPSPWGSCRWDVDLDGLDATQGWQDGAEGSMLG
jgi:hypothetical protein